MSSSSDQWMQFYQQQNNSSDGHGSVVTTSNNQLSPEGRVTKPIRRRSRVSKRTPTTLLSTDTTNFRAMVQQFTGGVGGGGATIPFSSGTSHYYSNDNCANLDHRQQPQTTTSGLLPERNEYNFIQVQQQLLQPQRQQSQVFSLNDNGGTGEHVDRGFFQGLVGGTNTSNPSIDLYDGFDRSVSPQVPLRPFSSSNKFNDNPYRY